MALTQITSIGIKDGEIVNADLSSGAAIALSKLSISGTGSSSNFLRGDGSWQTVPAGISLSGSTNNTIATVTGANALQGEANLTFDGNNLDINGAPWTVTGGNWRNLSISGEGSGASGFLWLGNGAAATNADFDLARVNICNGATIVSQIAGSTQTSANDDGRLSFQTKVTGGSLTEKLRITSAGRINIGGSDVNSYSANSAVDDLVLGGTSSHGITVLTGNSSTGNLWFDSANGNRGYIQYAHNEEALILGTENNERLRIDSTGRALIGTTTEGHGNADDLTINNSGHAGMTIRSGTSNDGNIFFSDATSGDGETKGVIKYAHNGDYLRFDANGSERLRIDSSGRIILGGTASFADGNSDDFQLQGTAHTGMIIKSGTSHYGSIYFGDGTSGDDRNQGIVRYGHSDNAMQFWTSAAERLRIQSTGVVNIGDSTASSLGDRLLQIGKTDRSATYAEFRTSTSGVGGIVFSDGTANNNTGYRGTIEYSHGNDALYFKTAATERLRITDTGNVGIGTTNPSELLHLAGATNPAITLQDTTNNTDARIKTNNNGDLVFEADYNNEQGDSRIGFEVDGSEQMRIDTSGNVGIGTTSPGGLLHVYGASGGSIGTIDGGSDDLIIENSTSAGIAFKVPNTERSTITFAAPGTGGQNEAWIQYAHESVSTTADRRCMMFRVGGGEKMRIDGAGRVFQPQQPRFAVASGNNLQNNNSNYWGDGSGGSAGTGDYLTIQSSHNGGNAVPVNVGSHYDGSSGNNRGKFTVPVAGTYYFYLSATMSDSNSHFVRMSVNGSDMGNTIMLQYDSTYQSATMCQLFTLSANDYVQVKRRGNGNSMYSVCWGGWLVA